MYSPCVFVCLSQCLSGRFDYEGLVPHKQYLQVHSWGCRVVQVLFLAFMVSSMTSPGYKVGQIFKYISLRQYFNQNVDQKLKISEILMAILLAY